VAAERQVSQTQLFERALARNLGIPGGLVSSARGEGRERRVTTKSPPPAGALACLGGSSATRPVGNRHLDQGLRANLGLSRSQRSGTTVARPSLSDCHFGPFSSWPEGRHRAREPRARSPLGLFHGRPPFDRQPARLSDSDRGPGPRCRRPKRRLLGAKKPPSA
jgi:hypothetical protein